MNIKKRIGFKVIFKIFGEMNFMKSGIDDVKAGRFISLVLRHHPEAAGVVLDGQGYADTEALIRGVARKFPGFSRGDLERIVRENNKQRYGFSEDGSKIRARQGHSIPGIDVGLQKCVPPEVLFHGTAAGVSGKIFREGIMKMSRQYVHLSKDFSTAENVGRRHGKPFVFLVRSGDMHRAGHEFFLSENGVWLTDHVPPEFLDRAAGD